MPLSQLASECQVVFEAIWLSPWLTAQLLMLEHVITKKLPGEPQLQVGGNQKL